MRRFLTPSFVGDLAFLNALLVVGAVSWWPLYQTPWLFVAGAAGIVGANLVAVGSIKNEWPALTTIVVAIGVYVVGGMLCVAPELYASPSRFGRAFVGVVGAPVTGWKNLLTLDLPLGDYREVLAPFFLVVFVAALGSLLIAWRSERWWVLAAPVAWSVSLVAAAFGSNVVWYVASSWLSWQLGVALVSFFLGVGWALWRIAARRKRALLVAEDSAGATVQAAGTTKIGRRVLGAAMVCAAIVGAGVAAPALLQGDSRAVLRTRVDPQLFVSEQVSPLSTYRKFFTDEALDEQFFTVDGSAERVRLATLNYFDGATALPVKAGSQEDKFVRVPYRLDAGDSSEVGSDATGHASIEIGNYQGAWVPLVGALESINFTGERRDSLEEGFFYNQASATGVQTAPEGLQPGDTYQLTAAPYLAPTSEVSTFKPGGRGGWVPEDISPNSVSRWIAEQNVERDGAGLMELVNRLRARGYLSHSLVVDPETSPAWLETLEGTVAVSSRAGHSVARIDELFTELLERQEAVGVGAEESQLVAAVGDDEQFAVAAALIANELGFDVRIAVGAVLTRESTDPSAIPTCEAGACYGRNMTAWIEVRDASSGRWAALDVTPQHQLPPNPEPEQRSDPKNFTPVQPKSAEALPPPPPNPRDGIEAPDPAPSVAPERPVNPIWRAVGLSALAVLLLALPFAAIIGAKALRSNRRQGASEPRKRVLGGWEEFVDNAVDRGLPEPQTQTRREIAATYIGHDPAATYLAAGADFAAFSADPVSEADAANYWEVVAEASAAVSSSEDARGDVRAKLSLKSFRRTHGV